MQHAAGGRAARQTAEVNGPELVDPLTQSIFEEEEEKEDRALCSRDSNATLIWL